MHKFRCRGPTEMVNTCVNLSLVLLKHDPSLTMIGLGTVLE